MTQQYDGNVKKEAAKIEHAGFSGDKTELASVREELAAMTPEQRLKIAAQIKEDYKSQGTVEAMFGHVEINLTNDGKDLESLKMTGTFFKSLAERESGQKESFYEGLTKDHSVEMFHNLNTQLYGIQGAAKQGAQAGEQLYENKLRQK